MLDEKGLSAVTVRVIRTDVTELKSVAFASWSNPVIVEVISIRPRNPFTNAADAGAATQTTSYTVTVTCTEVLIVDVGAAVVMPLLRNAPVVGEGELAVVLPEASVSLTAGGGDSEGSQIVCCRVPDNADVPLREETEGGGAREGSQIVCGLVVGGDNVPLEGGAVAGSVLEETLLLLPAVIVGGLGVDRTDSVKPLYDTGPESVAFGNLLLGAARAVLKDAVAVVMIESEETLLVDVCGAVFEVEEDVAANEGTGACVVIEVLSGPLNAAVVLLFESVLLVDVTETERLLEVTEVDVMTNVLLTACIDGDG